VLIKFNNNKQLEIKDQEISLLEVCRRIKAPINFGCRIGMCGTCIITIVGDINNVSCKNEAELDFTTETNERLACQCTVKGDIYVDQLKKPIKANGNSNN